VLLMRGRAFSAAAQLTLRRTEPAKAAAQPH
jgi:hypothetical protein